MNVWTGSIPTLQGFGLQLEPLTIDHAPELHTFSPPNTFQFFTSWPLDISLAAFHTFLATGLSDTTRRAFLVRNAHTGRAVGSTSFLDVRPAHKGLEIGCTWYDAAARGTAVNPAAKLLLMDHAFGPLAAERAQLKCDNRNEHSKRAMLKAGATFEGLLRKHLILADGFVRDTAMFSVIRQEWPTVRAGLLQRVSTQG